MPTQPGAPSLSIVVAVKDGADNLADVLEAVAPALNAGQEVLVVAAGELASAASSFDRRLGVLESPAHSLVPELWRDGILAARGAAVALTTAHCVPTRDWVRRLLEADLAAYAGVGGIIDLCETSTPLQAAVYLLRYSAFSPPKRAGVLAEIAADNAVYRRSEILRHQDLLRTGFWEPSFHRRFAADGLSLWFDPELAIVYRGRERAEAFARHRLSHGAEYGLSRGLGASRPKRLMLLAASPLVPPLILARILLRMGGKRRFRALLPAALPYLLLFATAWSLGEAQGYARALLARS